MEPQTPEPIGPQDEPRRKFLSVRTLNFFLLLFTVISFYYWNRATKVQFGRGVQKYNFSQNIRNTAWGMLEEITGDFNSFVLKRQGRLKKDRYYEKGRLKEGLAQGFYGNGKLKQEGLFKEGLQEGLHVWYASDGRKEAEITYKNGKPHGLTIHYYPNGNIMKSETYFMGKRDGEAKVYSEAGILLSESIYQLDAVIEQTRYDDKGRPLSGHQKVVIAGVVALEGNYKNGRAHGLIKSFDKEGRLTAERNYVNGVQHGLSKNYEENPSGRRENHVMIRHGERDGEYKQFIGGKLFQITNYINGEKIDRVGYELRTGLPRDGVYNDFHEGSIFKGIYTFKKGRFEGPYTMFYPNGKPREEGYYRDDKLHGEIKFYDRDGTLFGTRTFADGVLNGPTRAYYPNGKLLYEEDRFEGEIVYRILYDQNGKLYQGDYNDDSLVFYIDISQEHYKDGLRNGIMKFMTESQTPTSEHTYRMGVKEGHVRKYDVYGKIMTESTFSNGSLNGPFTTYYPTGQIKWTKIYKESDLVGLESVSTKQGKVIHGPYEFRFKNGRTEMAGTFVKGKPNGKIKWWEADGSPKLVDNWTNGVRHGETLQFEKGKPKFRSQYKNGKLISLVALNGKGLPVSGKWSENYPDGTLKHDVEFSKGNLNGIENYYYHNGKVYKSTTYKNGQIVGEIKIFDSQGRQIKNGKPLEQL